MDIADNEREVGRLRDTLAHKRDVDRVQDQDLDKLWREVDRLELAVGALTRLCVQKGVFSADEIGRVLDAADPGDKR